VGVLFEMQILSPGPDRKSTLNQSVCYLRSFVGA
jgi:hypothetical protein